MTVQSWLAILTAVAGGLGTGIGISVWLVKREVGRVMAVVDRVPQKEWFERVEQKLDHLDPERMDEHYKRVREHGADLVRHDLRLTTVERQIGDHETRLRVVEVKSR